MSYLISLLFSSFIIPFAISSCNLPKIPSEILQNLQKPQNGSIIPTAFIIFHTGEMSVTSKKRQIKSVFSSIRLTNPNSERILITDDVSGPWDFLEDLAVVLKPRVNSSGLNYGRVNQGLVNALSTKQYNKMQIYRLKVEEAYLRELALSSLLKHVVIMDSDMLVVRDFADFFASTTFEIAVTVRNHAMAINTGIKLVSGWGIIGALHAYNGWIEYYSSKVVKRKSTMFGEQYSLQEYLALSCHRLVSTKRPSKLGKFHLNVHCRMDVQESCFYLAIYTIHHLIQIAHLRQKLTFYILRVYLKVEFISTMQHFRIVVELQQLGRQLQVQIKEKEGGKLVGVITAARTGCSRPGPSCARGRRSRTRRPGRPPV